MKTFEEWMETYNKMTKAERNDSKYSEYNSMRIENELLEELRIQKERIQKRLEEIKDNKNVQ